MGKLLIHIPHSSKYIPDNVLSGILLSKEELDSELNLITDLYVDALFKHSNSIKFDYSRLVCDVERFRNDRNEPMSKLGMGAVYSKTSSGKQLRHINDIGREHILKDYYDVHHDNFKLLVAETLIANNECIILDCHSFSEEFSFLNDAEYPDICIGTDDFHTSKELLSSVVDVFKKEGYSVGVNKPYKGSIVPIRYFNVDKRVQSIMVEINKRVYLDSRQELKRQEFDKLKNVCNNVIKLLN